MAHITRSIEIPEPVGVISEQWTEFEKSPAYAVDQAESRVRWRAEVLTFEPIGDHTRVTLRIDYDPTAAAAWLPDVVEGALEGFQAFLAKRPGAGARQPAMSGGFKN